MRRINVSAWHNSNPNNVNGNGYGIRISTNDLGTIRHWRSIRINDEEVLRENCIYNEDCPEIRSNIIGLFLIRNNMTNWPNGQPSQLTLLEIENNIWQLEIQD